MSSSEPNTIKVRIERVADEYEISVAAQAAGETSDRFAVSAISPSLKNLYAISAQVREAVREIGGGSQAASFDASALKAYGQHLYETVFTSKARVRFHSGLKRDQTNLIQLYLNDVPELAGLAWEYLFDSDKDDFLCLSSETPIVRYLEVPQPVKTLEVQGALTLLAVAASPQDPRYPALNVDQELSNLEDALKGVPNIELRVLKQVTKDSLQTALLGNDVHILHFIGHGDYDHQAGTGMLLFEDGPVSAQKIKTLLGDRKALKLVVLNACKGARSSEGDSFVGTAQMLVKAGVPGVVAMQFAITDDAAITFAERFYGAIARDCPVDAALTEARKALALREGLTEWGTPVLFMRTDNGQIFRSRQVVPEPPGTASGLITEAAKTLENGLGLGRLSKIISESKEAKQAAMKFRFLFETASSESAALEYYKNLHDQLHNLRIGCYDFMVRVLRRASQDADDLMARGLDIEMLEDQCQLVLADTIFELRSLAEDARAPAYDVSWIDELSDAEEALEAAIAAEDVRALKRAESLMGRVLNRRSVELNTRLKAAADNLNLPGLLAALNELVEGIPALAANPSVQAEDFDQFTAAVRDLTRLQTRLTDLLNLHDECQNVDHTIHELMASLIIDPDDAEQIAYSLTDWTTSKTRVNTLFRDYASAGELRKYELKIDHAFGQRKLPEVKRYLRNYRRGVNLCFYRVDKDLQDQCKELRPMVAPLASVLEFLT